MIIDDLRHSWRRVRVRPVAAALVAVLIALGVGLTSAAFTVVDGLLLRPVPFPGAERLINLDDALTTNGVAPPVAEWRQSPLFDAVERAEPMTVEMVAPSGPTAVAAARVTPGVFDMLDARPLRGRLFEATEGIEGSADRVIVSESVWRSRFAADPDLLGSRIEIDDTRMLVVGIMPADFRFPSWNTEAWVPFDVEAPYPAGFGGGMTYARVTEGRPVPESGSRLEDQLGGKLVLATRVVGDFDDFTRRAFWGMALSTGLIFLILCANVTGLLLARLATRRRELGVCSALGASSGRLVRQALVEHVMLGATGVMAGIFVAVALVGAARGLLSDSVLARSLNPLNLDERALAITALLGLVVAIVCGVVPAWIGVRGTVSQTLRSDGRTATDSPVARWATRGLLVGQIACACALLTGATLLARSFVEMTGADRGLTVDGVLTVPFRISGVSGEAERQLMLDATTGAFNGMPGIDEAVVSGRLPVMLSRYGTTGPLTPVRPGAVPVDVEAEVIQAPAAFFRLFRIAILQGRAFEPGDLPTDAIVGERLASALWPGESPVGRSFIERDTSHRVIGVAREITVPSLDRSRDRPEFYVPAIRTTSLMLSLRCASTCPPETAIAQRLASVHPGIRPSPTTLIQEDYEAELGEPRAIAGAAVGFGAVSLATIAGGLFAVLTYAVRRRRRHYGIRAALGASPGQLGWSVAREGLVLSTAGVSAGAGLAWLLARWLSALQYGVSPLDPATWLTVLALVGATSLAASWQPAREARRADPLELLRSD